MKNTIAPEKLRAVAERLRTLTMPSEQVFLSVGHRLEDAIGVMRRIGEDMDHLALTVGGDDVRVAVERLRSTARSVVSQSGNLAAADAVIERLAAAGEHGGRSIAKLRQTVSEVAILGINAKILTAQLTANQSDFSAFIDEIGRLARAAGDGLEDLARRHADLIKMIAGARIHQHEFATTQGQALIDVGRGLDESLALLEQHHRWTMELVARTGKRSAEVGRLIGQAVRTLQINDITRQRVEHVIGVLEKGMVLLEGRNDWSKDLDTVERHQLAGILCHLQAAQLRRAAQQFETDVGSLMGTLQSLARDAEDMGQGAEGKPSAPSGQGEVTGSLLFRQLGRELDEARGLLVRFGEARASIRAAIGQVTAEARAMAAHVEAVRSIETDIRIMGLNATLKYARLGSQGRALAVIAQELRHCAGRTREQAKNVETDLDGLLDGAGVLEANVGNGAGEDGEDVLSAMSGSLGSLRESEQDYTRRMARMRADGGRAHGLLAAAATQIDGHRGLARDYRDVADGLEALASSVIDHVPADDQLARYARDLLKGQYTMAAEREIHQLFLGGETQGEEDGADRADPPEQDLEDILF